jgi:hypothetical protein
MEQTRRQIRETLVVRQALTNIGELEEADVHYAKRQRFGAHLLEKREAKYKNLCAKLDSDRMKTDAD